MNEAEAMESQNLAEDLSGCTDEQLRYILEQLSRLDFDRIRRTANYLVKRRNGK